MNYSIIVILPILAFTKNYNKHYSAVTSLKNTEEVEYF